MIGLQVKDISKDILMIFIMCYEYSMSFTNMLKLFNISKKYFWTFLEICNPMIKMGVRKAAMIRKSVDNIYPYLKSREIGVTSLTPREDKILEAFNWFLEDSFTDGDGCLHVSQFKAIPFAKGFTEKGVRVASTYPAIISNLDRISYITMGDNKFYKTSRFLYYMERYSGDTDVRELNALSVKEMLKRIADGEEKQQEEQIYGRQ